MTWWQDTWSLVIFFHAALAAGSAIAIGGAVTGTFVLLRREAMMALALPQIVAVGVALGLRQECPTLPPAVAAVALTVGLRSIGGRGGTGHWLWPAAYIAGLSLSFLLIANAGAHVTEMQGMFTGMDVAVSDATAAMAVAGIVGAAAVTACSWRRWLLLAQIPAHAELAGLHPGRWDGLFVSLLAAVVLLGTYAMGAVMVLAMLFLPAATVLPFCRRIPTALVAASALSLLLLGTGFVLANSMNWPWSHSVGGTGLAILLIAQGVRWLSTR